MSESNPKYEFISILKVWFFFILSVFPACDHSEINTEDYLIESIEEYRALRLQKLNESRPVIHNNDGCDAYVYPDSRTFSIYMFLELRTAGLKGSDVSTISYCTIASSFGQFTHNTKVGEFLTLKHNRPGSRNVVSEFVELGTDPLEVTCTFAHENGFEFFWSNRINDTHDYEHRPDNPYERWSKLKSEHPEYLFGAIGEKLPHGRWSAVDFSHAEIRDLCVQYYSEVCKNYDVDGIELDFFRHLYLFRNVARGGFATPAQLNMLTDMVARIREVTEHEGMKKGKPVLVLVRVPDCLDYCRGVGIDLETWMGKGLIDIVVGSGYFRLNFWDYLVNTGHSHQVKVYAGLSEPRVKEEHPLMKRLQNSVYRARSLAAWQAGVDGIYIFNEYNTKSKYLSEIGNQANLEKTNNLYFATYRNANPASYLKDGKSFCSIPVLTPQNTVKLGSENVSLVLEIGNESITADIALILYTREGNPELINAGLNGVSLEYSKSTDDGLSVFKVPVTAIRPGKNNLTLALGNGSDPVTLLDAALFFYRNKDDHDNNELVELCFR